jgi:hypothetical protein
MGDVVNLCGDHFRQAHQSALAMDALAFPGGFWDDPQDSGHVDPHRFD